MTHGASNFCNQKEERPQVSDEVFATIDESPTPVATAEPEVAGASAAEAEATPKQVSDLKPRMAFDGRVTRVTLGGAFVDVGIGVDGFLHVSQIMTDNGRPVTRVADVLKEGDIIKVYVLSVKPKENRFALTMRPPAAYDWDNLQVGMKLTNVKVVSQESFGVFVDFDGPKHGLIPLNQIPRGVKQPAVGDVIEQVWVTEVDAARRRIGLTMIEPPELPWNRIRKGERYKGQVVRVERSLVTVDIGAERDAMVRASAMNMTFADMRAIVSKGEEVTVRITRVDPGRKVLDAVLENVDPQDYLLSAGPDEELSSFAAALKRAQQIKRMQNNS